MNQHTVKAYGDELNQITAEIARMGGLAEAQVADAIDSVARRDIALARAVVERDLKLDALHRDIEKKAIRLIALRQPVASDLRRTLGAMKIATDLEHALLAVGGDGDVVAFLFEIVLKKGRQRVLVFHHKDIGLHVGSPVSGQCVERFGVGSESSAVGWARGRSPTMSSPVIS